MNRKHQAARRNRFGSERGAQLAEFAVALPLLVVFVVGIFDFSGALTLKQKLATIARDAARTAAADPGNDLQLAKPMSVTDAYYVVVNYLHANNLSDCGIPAIGTRSGSSLTWTFTASGGGCPAGGIQLIVNRGYYYPLTGGTASASCQSQDPGSQSAVVSTCVSIKYAYPWRFGRAASLLGATIMLPAQISAVGVAMNEN